MAEDERQRMREAAVLMEAIERVNAVHEQMARELEASRRQLAQAQAAERETRRRFEALRSGSLSPPPLAEQEEPLGVPPSTLSPPPLAATPPPGHNHAAKQALP